MKGKKLAKKIIFIVITILLAVLIIRSCIVSRDNTTYMEETVRIQDITTYYTFSGNIEAESSQSVFSQGILSVKTFHVKEGDMVEEGDLLLEFDDSTITDNLEQARSNIEIARINYEKAKGAGKQQQLVQVENALTSAQMAYNNASSNLERMTELYNNGIISKVELDQAQDAYDNALVSLDSAKKNLDLTKEMVEQNIRTAQQQLKQAEAAYNNLAKQLEDTKIYAEIGGEVDKIYVEENDSLVMGTKIMDIVNYNDLQVTIKVDEYDLSAVTPGEEAEVIINALNKTIKGKIDEISRQALVVNGVSYFPTSIILESHEDLRVGMSVEVKILNHNVKDAVTVSMKALQFDNENKPFVYCRDSEGNVTARYVDVGVNDGTVAEIISGVEPGEIILVPNRMYPSFGMTYH